MTIRNISRPPHDTDGISWRLAAAKIHDLAKFSFCGITRILPPPPLMYIKKDKFRYFNWKHKKTGVVLRCHEFIRFSNEGRGLVLSKIFKGP